MWFEISSRPALLIIILVLIYAGPYIFVFGRTATWTLPRIDERDFKAIEAVESSINQEANLTNVQKMSGREEATYSVNVTVLHRKFLDWIGFPLVLEVNNFNFKAVGFYKEKTAFVCSHFESALPKPTGTEPWYIYQQLVDKNDNSSVNVSCYGDASFTNAITNIPESVTFTWSMSATLVGDRNEEVRAWNGTQSLQVKDMRSVI